MDFEQASANYLDGLTVAREAAQRFQEASCLCGLGRVAYEMKDWNQAHQYLYESLAVCREIDSKQGVAQALSELGCVSIQLENYTAAEHFFHESLQMGVEIEVIPIVLGTMISMAELVAMKGNFVQAAELLTFGLHHSACRADTRVVAERLLSGLEKTLPRDVFVAAYQRGEVSELETVIRTQIPELSVPPAKALPVTNPVLLDPLTRREREVLALIVEGSTNREIAGQLYISLNTVKKHVNHIFTVIAS